MKDTKESRKYITENSKKQQNNRKISWPKRQGKSGIYLKIRYLRRFEDTTFKENT